MSLLLYTLGHFSHVIIVTLRYTSIHKYLHYVYCIVGRLRVEPTLCITVKIIIRTIMVDIKFETIIR